MMHGAAADSPRDMRPGTIMPSHSLSSSFRGINAAVALSFLCWCKSVVIAVRSYMIIPYIRKVRYGVTTILYHNSLLQGDENGCLGLTYDLLRVFVTNDRAGVYDLSPQRSADDSAESAFDISQKC